MKDVIDFFNTNVPADSKAPKLTPSEFKTFWTSCSDADKDYYKSAAAAALGR